MEGLLHPLSESFPSFFAYPTRQNPGLKPISIGEQQRGIVGKVVTRVFKPHIQSANGSLCAGQIALPPSPLGHAGDITFFGFAPISLLLYFFLAPPYVTSQIAPF